MQLQHHNAVKFCSLTAFLRYFFLTSNPVLKEYIFVCEKDILNTNDADKWKERYL